MIDWIVEKLDCSIKEGMDDNTEISIIKDTMLRLQLEKAARHNRLDLIKHFVNEKRYIQIEDSNNLYRIKREISSNGNTEILDWLLSKNVRFDSIDHDHSSFMLLAASNGQFDMLRKLHAENIGICGVGVIYSVASRGNMEILKWLNLNRTEGCSRNAMDYAATHGRTHVVKWLHYNRSEGCSERNTIDYLEILTYILDHRLHTNLINRSGQIEIFIKVVTSDIENNRLLLILLQNNRFNVASCDSYRVDFESIYVELLNKSRSYTINFENNHLFKYNIDYFKQSHIINNKRYHSISRFTNSNAINDVYLVCGTDHRLVRSIRYLINQLTIIKLTKSIQKYVYKKINYKDYQKSYERAENEIKAMKLLKGNPRFVQLVDHHHDKDNQIFHIITKYCKVGDLSQKYKHLTDINLYISNIKQHDFYQAINHFYIEYKNRIFPESFISNYISQLFNILLDLDKHGIVHCDIKPSNIFIDEPDAYGTLILGDFGCCEFIDQSTIIEYQDTKEHTLETNDFNLKTIDHEISEPTFSNINATRGTKGYISPEAKNRQYAQSCDIFSIGSTILKLLCCHQDDRNNHQLFQTKREIKISECRYSKQLIEFILRLLDQSPKNRESLNQILNKYIETITNNQIITFNLNTPFHNTSVNVTEINFGNEFNQILSIGVLPESLKSLVFGNEFNQILSVVGVLPKSLESLKFGNRFNQILSVGVLPESLESLVFGDEFNQILSVGVLPESLESLLRDILVEEVCVGILDCANIRLHYRGSSCTNASSLLNY
ncbi:hypothetical protein PPL_07655 [Heterostelium album PN500]|uniref:non-specific serine/threonine protein kinase n=1 Tax=Heterostelium pallidum (strain ATCC 26659 / Pp 5 / PN500) TaxID=670386 RepID=D3BGK3_HETP5|nr:hypothetical protein PPL_07655 [Heterostelium album PN500]EFA79237.1 hypothetical protein PPL_07655 [Heterostelium album PN500]|eukprot:XP_020431358.1 hypothetical protein PPL_07655 [Heterostelium album PN500]